MVPSSCQPAVATTVVSSVRLVGEPAVDDRGDLEPFAMPRPGLHAVERLYDRGEEIVEVGATR